MKNQGNTIVKMRQSRLTRSYQIGAGDILYLHTAGVRLIRLTTSQRKYYAFRLSGKSRRRTQ